ncbi:hypothetical protein EDC01DRAFT_625201 [Geopyxis carbonaria]|nr:hypothetical protein EDC01DRAFT_625201 [Geopyxis carbonaria]
MKSFYTLFHAFFLLAVVSADTPTNRCGPSFGNQKCSDLPGVHTCCSKYGWCGNTPEHCETGCQSTFGVCFSTCTTAGGGGTTTPPTIRPTPGNVPYGTEIYGCNVPGTIALTYDDGPYTHTDGLLDVLKAKGVKATFFIAGNNIGKGAIDSNAKWRAVIRRAYNEGHQIASHTWDHVDLSTLTPEKQRYQMTRVETALLSIIGRYPTYMRPPFISCTDSCKKTMKELGYHVIIWDLNTQDYKNTTPETAQKSKDIVRNYIMNSNSAIRSFDSIAHDTHFQTVYNLTSYQIDIQKAAGYRHVRLGECLADPEANWYRTQQ